MSGTSEPPQPIRAGGNNSVLRHLCMDCANYYPDLDNHQCLMTGQRLGHTDAGEQ
ncbi:unnamed protein product, partial [Allacma fusca]